MTKRATQLLFGTHTDFFELFNSVLITGWGLWLLLPFETFSSTNAFAVLDVFIAEELFGLIPLIIGVYIIYTLIAMRIKRRRYGLLAASAFWIFISIIIAISNISFVGVVVYAVIALFSAISYLRQ
jgi:hypothetical protein